ncbi:TPA: tetratricopeptide repeat protein [Candidatus Berkelbacteria bacterium]|uniref:Uncharacterized protein n=1 Tax=Berkelbacteria bacterium GW2011_GWE1_39_12 TaxID=1618337 RepID=A0A0G4B1S5_9BACT|nr:MAG: hypothetical protein UT28_C0001G0096 [Berkelbacteria bacterium GW2011_GWE1_39_12]HBO60483.1 tetratricopeptide repeat protein [Candidatus Berkelbacteria bacterium]
MIWNAVVIGAIILALVILIRKLPLAFEMQKKENPELSEKEMTVYGLLAQADDAFDRKSFIEAEELYVKAAANSPQDVHIFNRLGIIYLEQNNFYDAKEAFRQTVKLEEKKASHSVNLGLAYLGLKDYFKASQAFDQALVLDPGNKKYQEFLQKAKDLQEKESKKK